MPRTRRCSPAAGTSSTRARPTSTCSARRPRRAATTTRARRATSRTRRNASSRSSAAAYRASGRDRPIFDTLAHHVYGSTPGEPPGQQHGGGTIGEGDYAKLVGTLAPRVRRNAAAEPGPIWYLEAGFETTVDRRQGAPATPGARLGAGDPAGRAGEPAAGSRCAWPRRPSRTSTAWFNFLLWDEPRLEGWQSGLYFAEGTPSPPRPLPRRRRAMSTRRAAEGASSRASPVPRSHLQHSPRSLSCWPAAGLADAAESPARIRRRNGSGLPVSSRRST